MTRAVLRKRPKYGNRITMVDGIRFHSAGEAGRWQELKLLQRGGAINSLQRQVALNLCVYPPDQKPRPIGKLIVDFVYDTGEGFVYEDYKGMMTPLAAWKIKHAEAQYGIKIKLTGKR